MNMDEVLGKREQVSALADGRLADPDFAAALDVATADDDGRASWHVYHLVGDVMRSGELAACGRDRDFVARLNARLRAEPARSQIAVDPADDINMIAENDHLTLGTSGKISQSSGPANEAVFRWKMVAGFASLAAVAAIGWSVLGSLDGAPAGARLAQSAPAPGAALMSAPQDLMADVSTTAPGAAVMIRDPRLDELLAAHRQFGGTSALQNPSGFLRNATFEGTAAR